MARTLEQERAAYAWSVLKKRGSVPKEYVSAVSGAPALIMQNGLLQAVAYFWNKDDKENREVARHLMEWLAQRKLAKNGELTTFLPSLMDADASTYMRATEEAIALLKWLKHFGRSLEKG
jgi:CRISPR-associated protein Cmr5